MRYKPGHKTETRRRIVETASREFRARGFESVGIAPLMDGLNLTHGGFYAHFADKEQLVSEAVVQALGESLDRMLAVLERGGVAALLDFYLGEGHCDNPAIGCPLPALSAEVARRPLASRAAFTAKLREVFDALAAHLPASDDAQKEVKVGVLFAAMAGAVSLARASSDAELSRAILDATREHLRHFLGGTAE